MYSSFRSNVMSPFPQPSKHFVDCLDFIHFSLTDIFHFSLTDMFHFSITSGIFSQFFKSALVAPTFKRCLHHSYLYNYQSVSNLYSIVEILEKLALLLPNLIHTVIATFFNQLVDLVTALKQQLCNFLSSET